MEQFIADLPTHAVNYGIPILKAIVFWFIGSILIGWAVKMVKRLMANRGVDKTFAGYSANVLGMLLKLCLILAIVGMFGVATTSFVAILGALAFAIGMALQGSLGNFAGGALLVLFKPFKVDDYIVAQGEEGFVKDISFFTTELETPDLKTIYIPNGPLANGNITNVSKKGKVRLALPVGIGYGEDIKAARKVLLSVLAGDSRVMSEPAADVIVTELADSSVNLALRPWVSPGDAPGATGDLLEAAKIALDNAGIDIPFPQTVMHSVK